MSFIRNMKKSWARMQQKYGPAYEKFKDSSDKRAKALLDKWKIVERYKKLLLAGPVAIISLVLALVNMFKLPALVGLGLQSNGEYSVQLIREVAVLGPLILTSLCLMMLFASKRTLTPWMVSVISLLLPLMILLTNTFPY